MRYYVTIAGRTLEVDLRGDVAHVDGEEVEARLERIPGSIVRHLRVDGASHSLVPIRENRHDWVLYLEGERFEVEVVDERTRAIRAMTGTTAAARGPRPVRAPMPGLVVGVGVEPGDRVAAGQSIVVIEAMKMENDLKADAAGIVKTVVVSAGQAVDKGAVLVEFEAEDDGG